MKFQAIAVTRALMMLALISARVFAQRVPTRTLSKPAAVFAEPFSSVSGVREQSDGRVIVLDRLEIRILRVDFVTGKSTQLGRSGQGPGEYTLPIYLVALPGDTKIAKDMIGGGRALVIVRDAVSGTPLHARGFENKPLFGRAELQADARGRLYENADRYFRVDGKMRAFDSSGVRRLDRATGRVDTIGRLRLADRSRAPLVRGPLARRGLVLGQVAIATVLIPAAGMLTASLKRVSNIPMGFDPSNIVIASIRLPEKSYRTNVAAHSVFESFRHDLANNPSVSNVTFESPPLSGFDQMLSSPSNGNGRPYSIATSAVGPDYFATYRIPMMRGRGIGEDDNSGSGPVVVINAAAKVLLFGECAMHVSYEEPRAFDNDLNQFARRHASQGVPRRVHSHTVRTRVAHRVGIVDGLGILEADQA